MRKYVESMVITFVNIMKAGRGTRVLVFKKALDIRKMTKVELKKNVFYTQQA